MEDRDELRDKSIEDKDARPDSPEDSDFELHKKDAGRLADDDTDDVEAHRSLTEKSTME
jgi:hypothetical protein